MGFIIAIIIVVVILILALYIISVYNRLVSHKLKIENNFSQIEIYCKKRFDLVPNLVETVKGYTKHEKETLEAVIQARNTGLAAGTPAEFAQANNNLSGTLGKLFALAESYPDLKANTNFNMLQEQLVAIEKEIAATRGFYNDAVMTYNRILMIFPNNFVAGMFRFKRAEFFDAPEAETKNVQVKF